MMIQPAVIGIILNTDQTKVLLVKRRDIALWVLPGGGVDEGEGLEEALKREIQEETGFHIQIRRKCAEYTPINRLASLTNVFICQIESGQMALSDETAGIAFFSLKELPSTFFFPHAHWLQEGLSQRGFIQRSLTEISYSALCLYFIRHPWLVIRFAWTRFIKGLCNNKF